MFGNIALGSLTVDINYILTPVHWLFGLIFFDQLLDSLRFER